VKKTIWNYFARTEALIPPCIEKAFKDLEEDLPPTFHLMDVIEWIARQHMISAIENFDSYTRDKNDNRLEESKDVTDINSSIDDRHDITSETQSDSSNFNMSYQLDTPS
jgi:hypothetical protein